MTEDDAGPGQRAPTGEATPEVDWPTWLRTRLEEGPSWEETELESVTAELRSLRQAVEDLRAERDTDLRAGARPGGADLFRSLTQGRSRFLAVAGLGAIVLLLCDHRSRARTR